VGAVVPIPVYPDSFTNSPELADSPLNQVVPDTSKLVKGPDVPIPSLELPESHHKLFEPDIDVEAEKKATCVARPDPAIVAVPEPVVSAAQYQTEAVEFHFNTSPFPHPPRSLRPEAVTSSPELFDVTEVVPVVSESIVILSAERVIPFPAPIFIVVAPGPVPPVSPDPAVIAVTA